MPLMGTFVERAGWLLGLRPVGWMASAAEARWTQWRDLDKRQQTAVRGWHSDESNRKFCGDFNPADFLLEVYATPDSPAEVRLSGIVGQCRVPAPDDWLAVLAERRRLIQSRYQHNSDLIQYDDQTVAPYIHSLAVALSDAFSLLDGAFRAQLLEYQRELVAQTQAVVTEVVGHEDRALVRALQRWDVRLNDRVVRRPAELLEARREIVPFEMEGREQAWTTLGDFVGSRSRDDVLLITGPGGVGKTRLMLEWCKHMRSCDWLAGFLQHNPASEIGSLVNGTRSRLLVMDYAESEPAAVRRVLSAMVYRTAGPRMRVVLLARSKGPWWSSLRDDSRVADLLDQQETVELPDLYRTKEGQTRGFQHAHDRFVHSAGGEPTPKTARPLGSIGKLLQERVLYVHMRALLEAFEPTATALTAEDVLRRVLHHEQVFWWRWIEKTRDREVTSRERRALEQAACALVLCGPLPDLDAAGQLFDAAIPSLEAAHRSLILDCLGDIYAEKEESATIKPIEPDLLGEMLVRKVFSSTSDELRDCWLSLAFRAGAPVHSLTRTLTVLTRISARGVEQAWLEQLLRNHGKKIVERIVETANRGRASPPGPVLANALEHIRDGQVATAIGDAIPVATVELREVEVAAYEVAIRDARKRAPASRLARLLGCLGGALSRVGRREAALAATQEAVELLRKLTIADPDTFLGSLAQALVNLGAMLSYLGRREDALAATVEAVETNRILAKATPDQFLPDLATSLNNLGMGLIDLGRREEALSAMQEAVTTYRRLGNRRPDTLPGLAMALNNLGKGLSGLGNSTKALLVTEDAVEIYRELADARPDSFLPDLASSLNNLGMMLSYLGRREEALLATQEAVKIRRELATARPDAFLPDLVTSLNNLGVGLGSLGRREDALLAIQEAVDSYRDLARMWPETFLPELAGALNNLGMALDNLGRRQDALSATRKAIEIRRGLVKSRPEAFLPSLAGALNNYGTVLKGLGQHGEALVIMQEAVETYKELVRARPNAFLPELASALNNLGTILRTLRRPNEALLATREAVEIRRALDKRYPGTFLPELASALNNLGTILHELGRSTKALSTTQEAVEIRHKLAKERPDAYLPALASTLNNLGMVLSGLGRREEALLATQDAVETYRQLAKARPDVFLPDLANSLNNLGIDSIGLGHGEEALLAAEEAVEIRRELAKTHPNTFVPDLAMSLNNLGLVLSYIERPRDALLATSEAVEIHRQLVTTRPGTSSSDLASALTNLSIDLSALEREEEALSATQEAVELFRQLTTAQPAVLPKLASALNNLGVRLSELGHGEKAISTTLEAVELYRELAKMSPDAYLPNLAAALSNLGLMLSGLGRREEALLATQEATALRSRLADLEDEFPP